MPIYLFLLTSQGTKKLCVYDKNKNNIFIIILDEFKFEKPLYSVMRVKLLMFVCYNNS
jgi:hypothetical protein